MCARELALDASPAANSIGLCDDVPFRMDLFLARPVPCAAGSMGVEDVSTPGTGLGDCTGVLISRSHEGVVSPLENYCMAARLM